MQIEKRRFIVKEPHVGDLTLFRGMEIGPANTLAGGGDKKEKPPVIKLYVDGHKIESLDFHDLRDDIVSGTNCRKQLALHFAQAKQSRFAAWQTNSWQKPETCAAFECNPGANPDAAALELLQLMKSAKVRRKLTSDPVESPESSPWAEIRISNPDNEVIAHGMSDEQYREAIAGLGLKVSHLDRAEIFRETNPNLRLPRGA